MVVFSENGKSHYKITKNYFSCRNVCVLAHINVPLLVLSSPFLLNFGALMKWPPFGIHDLITMSLPCHHFSSWTSKATSLNVLSILPASLSYM